MADNRRIGPFAVVDRVTVFEDEKGVSVSILNPRSILRTVLMDDQKHAALIESHLAALRTLVSDSVKGTATSRDYGEAREKRRIGKTMGKWAFMKNMSMPGSIQDEIAAQVRPVMAGR